MKIERDLHIKRHCPTPKVGQLTLQHSSIHIDVFPVERMSEETQDRIKVECSVQHGDIVWFAEGHQPKQVFWVQGNALCFLGIYPHPNTTAVVFEVLRNPERTPQTLAVQSAQSN